MLRVYAFKKNVITKVSSDRVRQLFRNYFFKP